MTAMRRRPGGGQSSVQRGLVSVIIFIMFTLIGSILYLATTITDVPITKLEGKQQLRTVDKLRHSVVNKRHQLSSALKSLTKNRMPSRLKQLRESNEIVGERLGDIREGTETVEELLHGGGVGGDSNASGGQDNYSDKPPMQLDEIVDYLSTWIHTLHETLVEAKHESYFGIWQAYHDLTVKTLYPWDREYLRRMPKRRDDGSIFLSLATYRDENCLNTVKNAFGKAKDPHKLFIGLVQQNCEKDCKSGILVGGKTEVGDHWSVAVAIFVVVVVFPSVFACVVLL